MGDPFGRWNNPPPSRSEYEDSSSLQRSNSFARPSGKSIYNQRKDYTQNLLKPQTTFQHHVEHLLTVALERDIRSIDDCLERLKVLEAQGRVWGQDLILQVKDQELVLRDVESKEELESHPLGSVQGCWAALDICSYDSVLAISVQEKNPPRTSILLFQCEQLGAEVLKSSLDKVMKQWKEEQRSLHGHRSSPDVPPSPAPPYSQASERWAETPEPDFYSPPQRGLPPSEYNLPDTQQIPRTNPPSPVMTDLARDAEILGQVLGDIGLFTNRLRTILGVGTNLKKKKKKKKNKNKGALPSGDDYMDFFQKVKHALNLLGQLRRHMHQPSLLETLNFVITSLSFVLENCPDPHLAPAVQTPPLVPEALEMLEETLSQPFYNLWKSLGIAWNKTRAENPEYPTNEPVPHNNPTFSEGWSPPPQVQWMPPGPRDNPNQLPPPGPAQGLVVRALYEFQGRNPQELNVRMGDVLQVLDQSKKWWLVQDGRGEKGYVPSNILEPLGGHGGGHGASQLQESPPNLHPDSSPAEVTAWLKDKGFSRITVRCLGVLRGQQLLQMSPEELRAVCPEEWRRVLFKLSSVRTSLGIGPRD